MITVIVGHGKSTEGRKWGAKVDEADRVIRMFNWDWQPAADFGTRYDLGFFEIGANLIKWFQKHNRRQPKEGWLASYLGPESQKLPERTEVIDQYRWTKMGREMGGIGATGNLQFQRGTIAACWAIERSLPGDEVLLFGFDNVVAQKALSKNEGFSDVYLRDPATFHFKGYAEGETKSGNHDFVIEGAVLARLADRHGVTLSYSQTKWGDN